MLKFTEKVSLKDFTLIIPSTCVGNVSQLTSDLLIENLKMAKVALVWHSAIPPLVGKSAFEHIKDPVTTAAELYIEESKKLVVLQIRTPLTPPLMGDFFDKLVEFVRAEQVKDVILLTSCYGYEKHSVQGNDFAYKANKKRDLSGVQGLDECSMGKILGGGFALKMFEVFTVADIDTLLLYKYVSEGDNIPDAVQLLLKLNEIRKVLDTTKEKPGLTLPVSWKYLFGNRPPTEIY